ncbi:hypothetical protein [Neisseria blantyrii]|uniref:hypothetical protein n=1 Tax=Neisseria blantyrii TaxID=2830647 RepID=UPI00272CD32A|nr:hypothetical protein [Neisseria blantyrii]
MRLIAGKYEEEKGTAKTFTEMNVWDIAIHADKETALAVPETHNLSQDCQVSDSAKFRYDLPSLRHGCCLCRLKPP